MLENSLGLSVIVVGSILISAAAFCAGIVVGLAT